MNKSYNFSAVARSERFFVSTLLTHCLMSNNFQGIRALFVKLLKDSVCCSLKDDFELVSELDPLRDGSVYHSEVKKLYREFKRIAVPDLFLRWDNQCLVIEAKFFTDPDDENLSAQINEQKRAIEKVREFTMYKDMNFTYVALTLNKADLGEIKVITWDEIYEIIRRQNSLHKDIIYCQEIIGNAIKRAKDEASANPKNATFQKYQLDTLLEKLPTLIKNGSIYVGFSGGLDALNECDLDTLKNRSHYKVSDTRWSDNWITLDNVIRRYIELCN